jgi:hypothetical protein
VKEKMEKEKEADIPRVALVSWSKRGIVPLKRNLQISFCGESAGNSTAMSTAGLSILNDGA